MSTEPGSTAAGEPRHRDRAAQDEGDGATRRIRSEEIRQDADSNPTRRMETPSTEPVRTGTNEPGDTQVLDTTGHRADSEVSGTRDPNDAAYRTERTGTYRAPARDAGAHDTQHDRAGQRTREDAPAGGLRNREALLAAERERFGGIKFGAAFFGWLTATGMVVLLSALAAAIGAAVGVSTDSDLGVALDQVTSNQSANLVGAIITLAVLLLAYYAGGYVAGRMARFNGAKQGLAVWLWALVAAAVVIVLGLILNDDIRSLTQLNTVAALPQDLGDVSAGTWLALVATLAVSLVGAILGGLAGMRFHRRVDRATFTPEPQTT
ncbi:hypothetical protein [Arthrobacter sp. 7Tela_A1]|uniref:hypothetical protein n=1 Tax=Arthrobacter sp. 7Tela_A1 TaxID=3093745 RepID=UPI003BB5AA2C